MCISYLAHCCLVTSKEATYLAVSKFVTKAALLEIEVVEILKHAGSLDKRRRSLPYNRTAQQPSVPVSSSYQITGSGLQNGTSMVREGEMATAGNTGKI